MGHWLNEFKTDNPAFQDAVQAMREAITLLDGLVVIN